MAKYLDSTGLTHLWAKIKNYVATYITGLKLGDTYVAKEDGKGLSTNDYTTAEKDKLAGIAAGAEVNQNAFSNVKVGTTTIAADAKTDTLTLEAGGDVTLTPDASGDKVTISVTTPKKTSDLNNDSGFITIGDVPEGAAASTTTPKMDGTAAVGTETAFARGDHRHPSDTTKADDNKVVHLEGTETISGSKTVTGNTYFRGNVTAWKTLTIDAIGGNGSIRITEDGDPLWTSISDVTNGVTETLAQSLGKKADKTTTVNGHALSGNVTVSKSDVGLGNVTNDAQIPLTQKGTANGVCPLDANTKIDAQYLPSYVDDVVEAYIRSGQTALSSTWLATGSASGTVITPEAGKIYVLMADSGDYAANSQFRWGGTEYVKLNDGGVSAITNAEIDSITSN